jgi:hypothetical protein
VSALAALAGEAFGDALRRRTVPVVAGLSLLALLAVDGCTACGGTITTSAGTRPLAELGGWIGLGVFVSLSLWMALLAAALSADALASTLEDGSASLMLARPVSRDVFAAARLAGALGVALGTGAALLAAAAALLHARHGLALAPAWAAGAAALVAAACVGSLAMAASLHLPRSAVTLLALAGVAAVAASEIALLLGAQPGGVFGALGRFGPPLVQPVALALAPWIAPSPVPGAAAPLLGRLALWTAGGVVWLLAAFRRIEPGR